MAIKWGTDSKVQYIEPTYKFPLSIGASGEMTLSVENSRKLLVKLVGTERVLDRNQLTAFFRVFLMTRVKTYIAQRLSKASFWYSVNFCWNYIFTYSVNCIYGIYSIFRNTLEGNGYCQCIDYQCFCNMSNWY